ncbi:MAG: desulfoferrodoxin [Candidatus Gastranaerophilaceae bacterium]|jgi:superoxide reductase
MTKLFDIYKCPESGDIVEVLHAGSGELGCCETGMKIQKENTVDASVEKHVPVIEITEEGKLIKVGAVEHPMAEEHYIEFIEAYIGNKLLRKYLKPGDKPEFLIKCDCAIDKVRAYCNLHGLWKGHENVE